MSQPVEMEANITDLDFGSSYAELEAIPLEPARQELHSTCVPEFEAQAHTSEQPQPSNEFEPSQPTTVPSQTVREIEDMIIGLEKRSVEARTRDDNSGFNTFLAPNSKAVSAEGVVLSAIRKKWRR
jgi:hypothetical protein